MSTTRDQLEAALAVQDEHALRLVLLASEVDPRGAASSPELAARIADAIWWNYCTPLGYLTERATLEDVVRHVSRRLGVADRLDTNDNVWEQIRSLTAALVPDVPERGIGVATLDESTQRRLRPAFMPAVGWGTGAVGSFTARWGSGKILALLRSPLGRLLPLIPGIGPWVTTIKWGTSAVSLVSGPLGIALSVVSLNASLGSNYKRLVPLVLGVGALAPVAVDDAYEVDA